MGARTFLALALLASCVAGCHPKVPDRATPRGTYAAYIDARERHDFQAIYRMMVTPIQSQVEKTHANFREAARLVEANYPLAMQKQPLADLGPEALRGAPDPAAYFAELVRMGGAAMELSMAERWSAEVKTVREDPPGSGKFLVSPMSGSVVELAREEDGLVHMVPTRKDQAVIQREYTRSLDRLESVRNAVEVFRGARRAPDAP
jgi:hypothetical protein